MASAVRRRRSAAILVGSLLLSVACLVVPARGQSAQEQAVLNQIDFEQRLNEQVPLDAVFTDEDGKQVQLTQYFGKRPVILVMVFYECPMLCTEILNGTLRMMQEMAFTAGQEYEVVTISIDPREGPVEAMGKKSQYMRRYNREGTWGSWHFLTGKDDEIHRVADAIGYKYFYDEETAQYVHASGITVLTPTGRVSRYFYGVQYDAGDVRLGLVEASANKIGSPVDKLLLFCYHYDPSSGKYNVAVMSFVRVFGVFTVLAMIGGFFMLMRRDRPDPVGASKPGMSV
ncbi:MAG: SCO family protein [Blastocatellia bacterium]|jgi:protein SCO1/2|nr:SCO family protein [Blastocatellia bacterium]MBK6426559.1 SCO family protein [Blastocatellia bacterium]